ncbi:MAG: 2-C-methyl-D-erythritol 4-phosphate cytidylyltransferase [Myxococcota bacterium]
MPRRPIVAALVLAAGRGERLGAAVPKAFVELEGQTLLERSIRALAATGRIERIVPVVSPGELSAFDAIGRRCADIAALAPAVAGGQERQDSMQAGLASLQESIELVAVHDAARCLVDPADLERVLEVAAASGAAILGERVRDTLKRVVEGRILETPDRAEFWAAQTPQVFRRDWLEAATAAAARSGQRATDDSALVEALGHAVVMVEAQAPNPKITRPEDLELARVLLAQAIERAEAGRLGAGGRRASTSPGNRG